jgi:FtsP/CotA-like multicopper oxidase with cupredoxin domain
VVQHNGALGSGFKIVFPANCANHSDSFNGNCYRGAVDPGEAYVEGTHMDIVTALPGQVTIIRAKFDRPERYVWHCHILSHEDHEMMRTLYVGEGAFDFHHW